MKRFIFLIKKKLGFYSIDLNKIKSIETEIIMARENKEWSKETIKAIMKVLS